MRFSRPFLLITAVLLVAGCGQDQYAIERDYYRIQKQARSILINPDATPPNELANVVNSLDQFLIKYPKTNIAVNAQFTVAQLYIATKEYDQAHDRLKKMKKTFKDSDIICADTVFMRGGAYEAQTDWASALEQYQALIKEYPLTPRGMETPVYIAMHYKSKLQPEKMMSALREAATHYTSLSEKYPGTPLALKAQMMLAQAYLELIENETAIGVLKDTAEKFKTKIPTEGLMLDIAGIYYSQLKDADKAKEVLNKVIADHPKTPTAATAKQMIDRINETKK